MGCAAAKDTYRPIDRAASAAAGEAKGRFEDLWNSTIVPTYNAAPVSRDRI
jgi:hypothetical protein